MITFPNNSNYIADGCHGIEMNRKLHDVLVNDHTLCGADDLGAWGKLSHINLEWYLVCLHS